MGKVQEYMNRPLGPCPGDACQPVLCMSRRQVESIVSRSNAVLKPEAG